MDKKEKIDFEPENTRRKPLKLFTTLFLACLLAIALGSVVSPYLSEMLKGLLTGCTPLVIGIIIAFIFSKLVDLIENKLLKNVLKNNPHKYGIKRFISIVIVLLIIISIFVLIFSILVPKIVEIVKQLTTGNGDGWEQMVNRIVNEICALIQNVFGADVDQASIKNTLNSLFDSLRTTVLYIDSLLAISVNLISGIFNFIIGILIAVMILQEKERIFRFSKRFLYANFKKERADKITIMAHNSSKILYSYAICQLIQFLLLFFPLGIGYSLLGLNFTWELALIIGLFNFIPYFGIYIGCAVAALITLVFNSMSSTIYMLLVTLSITVVEFNIIVPIITGNKLKLSPFVITASVIIGGAMFGIVGMFLAPPVTALIGVIVMGNIEFKENKMKYLMELQTLEEERKKEEGTTEPQIAVATAVEDKNTKTAGEKAKQLSGKSSGKSRSSSSGIKNKTLTVQGEEDSATKSINSESPKAQKNSKNTTNVGDKKENSVVETQTLTKSKSKTTVDDKSTSKPNDSKSTNKSIEKTANKATKTSNVKQKKDTIK